MPAHQIRFLKRRPEAVPGGYIYLFQAVGTDKFKIGRAINVAKRLRNIQTSSPLKIRYVYHVYVQYMNERERELHAKFCNQREIGEWFTLSHTDVEFCILLMRLAQEGEPFKSFLPEKDVDEPESLKPIEYVRFYPEPELLTSESILYTEIQTSRRTGKSQTWIIENILKMKGRKFGEGKLKLQELLNQFEGKP